MGWPSRWFRRRRADREPDADRPDPRALADEFWAGWRRLLPEISAALGEREPGRVEHQLCDLVAALHPDLHFTIDRGQRSFYALVVTGQEDPLLRPYTDAWKAAAPPDDPIWEHHDSVPAVPDPNAITVNVGGQSLPLRDVRVVAQVGHEHGTDGADGAVVDVAVYHPHLAELPAEQRTAMTYLPLDATLGERLAGQRLRRVETALVEPAGTISLLELRDLVRELAGGTPQPDPRAQS